MMRNILAVIIGVVVGFIIVFIGDATTHKLNPANDNLNEMDKETLKAYIEGMPMYVMIIMVLFWLIAAFVGGLVSGKVNKAQWKNVSLITGGILLAATLLNLFMYPHPAWMWIVALVLIVPAAYLGGKLAAPKSIITV
jgi:hypothetical protein